MPPKQRELKKNYIGIVSDKTDEQHAVDSVAKYRSPREEIPSRIDGRRVEPRRRRAKVAVASRAPLGLPLRLGWPIFLRFRAGWGPKS